MNPKSLPNILDQLKNAVLKSKKNVIYIKLKIIPKSSITQITELLADQSWKMKVKAAPKKGKANKKIIKFFQKQFPYHQVEIAVGEKSRTKVLKLTPSLINCA